MSRPHNELWPYMWSQSEIWAHLLDLAPLPSLISHQLWGLPKLYLGGGHYPFLWLLSYMWSGAMTSRRHVIIGVAKSGLENNLFFPYNSPRATTCSLLKTMVLIVARPRNFKARAPSNPAIECDHLEISDEAFWSMAQLFPSQINGLDFLRNSCFKVLNFQTLPSPAMTNLLPHVLLNWRLWLFRIPDFRTLKSQLFP